jgi:dTDP-4-dehydrorhamnose reductase
VTRFLLTGASGMLGTEFQNQLRGAEVVTLTRSDLEGADTPRVVAICREARPEIVLNCAAHTDLEAEELEPAVGYEANASLPGKLAVACCAVGATMVHFSSTGCYGRWKDDPYVDGDALEPTTAHHFNKCEGEKKVSAAGCRYLIFRLGWLYGGIPGARKNFVWNRLLEAASRAEMTSDQSQRGCPTHVSDVVKHTLSVLNAGSTGVFNLVAHGTATRFDYVSEIVRASRLLCSVKPGPAFARRAPVSPNETAKNKRLQDLNLDRMRDWRISLSEYVEEVVSTADWPQQDRGLA